MASLFMVWSTLSQASCCPHTVKVLADFTVCDWWGYDTALCDVIFSQIEGNGGQLSHIELSNRLVKFSNSVPPHN